MQENEENKKTVKKAESTKKNTSKAVSSKKEKVEKTKEKSTRKVTKSNLADNKVKKKTSNSANSKSANSKSNKKKNADVVKKAKKKNESTSKVAKKDSVKSDEKQEKKSIAKSKKKNSVTVDEKKTKIADKVTKEVKSADKTVKKEKPADKTTKEVKSTAKTIKENTKKVETKKSSEKNDVAEVKENVVKDKVDQVVIIEKIKDFISKVISMQEEARKELAEENSKSKTPVKKENKTKTAKKEYIIEYYDLPYRYNETIVKILAQTPKKLFVYWDISDNDRNKYIETFGENFFETTYPVLLLYNEDKKYVKEVAINDFANSWYIDIDDPKTKYTIQLGRKFKNQIEYWDTERLNRNNIILRTDYLPFADSNVLEVPNDHVLLEQLPEFIVFRNVKTNSEIKKDIRSLKDIFGNNYDVKEFYESQYKDELDEGMFDMTNPSSNMTSSSFK